MIALVILVAMVFMVPLLVWSQRIRKREVRWQGIDWSRGMSEPAKLVAEGAEKHRAQKYREAIEAYEKALELDADRVEALLGRAAARHRLGKLDEALMDYDRAIALGEPNGEALNNRGCLLLERGEIDRALVDLKQATTLSPDDAVAHVSLAEALAAKGEWDASLDALQRGIALDASWTEHARTSQALASLRAARPDEPLLKP